MHRLFGTCEGQKCGDCEHFWKHERGTAYYKCEIYGKSNSEATDWRVKYPACGKFNKPYKGGQIVRLVGYEDWREADRDPIPGQISFEEANEE